MPHPQVPFSESVSMFQPVHGYRAILTCFVSVANCSHGCTVVNINKPANGQSQPWQRSRFFVWPWIPSSFHQRSLLFWSNYGLILLLFIRAFFSLWPLLPSLRLFASIRCHLPCLCCQKARVCVHFSVSPETKLNIQENKEEQNSSASKPIYLCLFSMSWSDLCVIYRTQIQWTSCNVEKKKKKKKRSLQQDSGIPLSIQYYVPWDEKNLRLEKRRWRRKTPPQKKKKCASNIDISKIWLSRDTWLSYLLTVYSKNSLIYWFAGMQQSAGHAPCSWGLA